MINRASVTYNECQWVQHSATIAPGSAGGPLMAENGKALGINNMIMRDESSGARYYALATPQWLDELQPYLEP